jgi:regulator of protease activity HflC (stomatin/prohibitin superfamily)
VSDDLARTDTPLEAIPVSDPEPQAGAHIQLTEVAGSPLDAGEIIERRDAYGRVPVMVRIRRQPPIQMGAVLLAVALAASGLLLPLALALRAVIIVAAVVAVVVGFISRIFLRIPPGSVGLVMKAGRHDRVLGEGAHRVNPILALTHIITTREIAFDVPVNEVRSSDGIGVSVDLMLTLQITEPVRFAYTISTGDLDQLVHATCQDAVRTLVRGIEALGALDLGTAEADTLRARIDGTLEAYGVDVRAVAFTRVTLPEPLTASLEAQRLSSVQLAEQASSYTLDRQRLADKASLVSQEAESRRAAVEHDAIAEAVRLAKLEERLAANPHAARYDMEMARLRIAQQLAGNSRAVVSLGGADLMTGALLGREAAVVAAAEEAAVVTAAEGATAGA